MNAAILHHRQTEVERSREKLRENMKNMPNTFNLLTLSALLGLCIISVECAGLDLGMCNDNYVECTCGTQSNGYRIVVPTKKCTFFYRWKPSCKPCDEMKDEVRCAPFQQCQECNIQDMECSRCPPNRYGRRCNLECSCQNGGVCDRISGRCVCPEPFNGNQCQATIHCYPPVVPVGGYSEPSQPLFKIGEQVKFHCENGFLLEGSLRAQCLQNGQWSSPSPQCISENKCPVLPIPRHGKLVLPSRRLQGVLVHYSCDDGYELHGASLRECLGDGAWSGKEPSCEKHSVEVPLTVCEKPDEVEFGGFTIDASGSSNGLTAGTAINFVCNDGYALVGSESIQCEENGSWSNEPPLCMPSDQVCRHPTALENGSQRLEGKGGRRGVMRGTIIHYSCDPLHYMVGESNATCLNTNRWSSRKPKCEKVISCGPVENLLNGQVKLILPTITSSGNQEQPTSIRSSRAGRLPVGKSALQRSAAMFDVELPEGHYHAGTRAVFSCESRYYQLIGSGTRMCMNNGLWSGRQHTCIPVCGRANWPRRPTIVGGKVSELGQFPWQVAIANVRDNQWTVHCGGALVSEYWVLTAAHCVAFPESKNTVPPSILQVYLGKHYRDDKLNDQHVQVRQVSEIIINPHYEPMPSLEADIALLLLSEPVKFTSRVQAVCLPEVDPDGSFAKLEEGKLGIISGWGITETGNVSDVLRYAEVPVVNNVQCEQDYAAEKLAVTVSKSMFCAGYEEGGRDSCPNDSGGPMVFPMDESRERWILEGIISWGSINGCGQPRQHGVYVRVQQFVEWILQHI